MRLTGALLVAAAAAISSAGLAWLLGPAQFVGMGIAISALRLVLLLTGSAMLVRPVWFARVDAQRAGFTGTALALLIIAVVGSVGAKLAPASLLVAPTVQRFPCTVTDLYCNRASEFGVANVPLYGRAAAFVDINMDGQADLFAVNADRRLRTDDWDVSWFYLNEGAGAFRPVRASGLGILEADLLSAWHASFADMDNDGDPDMALASGGQAGEAGFSVYENRVRETDAFLPVTDTAGFRLLNTQPARWWASGWADYDNDGLPDLAVSRARGPVHVFHNDGANQFTDVTRALGIATPDALHRDGRNVVWFDFDNDGDQDLYFAGIANHMLYENLAGTVFRDVTWQVFAGVVPDAAPGSVPLLPGLRRSAAGAGSGHGPGVASAAAADFNQDGYEDLYLARSSGNDLLLLNDGAGQLVPASGPPDILAGGETSVVVGMHADNIVGLGIGDFDDDGWPDVVRSEGAETTSGIHVTLCNRGGVLVRCTGVIAGTDGKWQGAPASGIAFGDASGDGATDILMTAGGDSWADRQFGTDSRQYAALFVRSRPAEPKTATVLLEGTASNRDALGARLRVAAAGTVHYYTVRSGQGAFSQNERALVVALGAADVADVEIRWPRGAVSRHQVRAGEYSVLRE